MKINFEVDIKNNCLFITICKPSITLFASHIAFEEIRPYLNSYEKFTLDLRQLKEFDSTFIALLINIFNTLQIQHKKLILVHSSKELLRALELYGILKFFEIEID